jgi:hypothetical protein
MLIKDKFRVVGSKVIIFQAYGNMGITVIPFVI